MNNLEWTTEKRKINDLVPHQNNPRKMSEKQVEDLKKSIEKFNLVEIPAIDTDNTILAGHQRLKIMQLIGRGDEVIDVRVPSRKLTDEERNEYLIRSNKNIGDWDFNLLANFDENLLLDVGFTNIELKKSFGLSGEDEEQFDTSPPVESKTVRGQIYELGPHRLMCGDSTNIEDIRKLMGERKAFMFLTDPPYNVNYEGATEDKLKIENDHMSDSEFKKFLTDVFANADSFLIPGGGILYLAQRFRGF